MSLNASKSSSYAVMGLDIVNALQGMASTAYILHMCKVNPRRIVPNKLIPDDYCLLGYLFGPMVCYVTFIICGIYFIGMDDHSDKFQSCMSTLGKESYKVTEGELNTISLLYVIYNTIRLGTCLLTNWLLAYLRKRRLILDKPNVKFFIISLQYYFALQWISDGWLTDELAVSRPLHSCVAPSNSSLYVILDFMILLYCTQAWEMYNGALSRKTKQVYLLDNDGDHKERKMNLF